MFTIPTPPLLPRQLVDAELVGPPAVIHQALTTPSASDRLRGHQRSLGHLEITIRSR